MCKTKFLQVCSFCIIFTSLHSLNWSFLLLFYLISTAVPKFPPWSCTLPPWFPAFICILPQIPDQDFKKIVTLVKKQTLPFVTTA